MEEANRLARMGAVIELLVCLLNGLVSTMWFLSLALFLVGFLWVVPLGLIALEVCLALVVLVIGQTKLGVVGPAIGLFVSVCNLNPMGGIMMIVAMVFQVKAIQAASQANEFEGRLVA